MVQSFKDTDHAEQGIGPVGNPRVVNDFMGALQRLVKIGVYYPSGHAILDQAMDRFVAIMASIAQERHFVRIEDDGKSLLLEQVALDDALPFVKEFRKLLGVLSITAIEINRDISRGDLSRFLRQLLAGRATGANIKQFASIELMDLPPSVSVTYKQYLAREADSEDGRLDSAVRNMRAFYEALAEQGLSEEQIEQCRAVLVSLPSRLEKVRFNAKDLPTASWEDVAFLLAQAIKGKPLNVKKGSHGNLDMLASILNSLEKDIHDRKSREAIQLLVSLIKKPKSVDEEDEDGTIFGEKERPQSTVAELQDFVNRNRFNISILVRIQDVPTGNESLSIMMQLLTEKQSLQNQSRILQFFNDIFADGVDGKAWEILGQGMQAVLKCEDRSTVIVAVRLVVDALRRVGGSEPLTFFLHAMKLCEGREELVLWPFAVNEVLVCGSSRDSNTFRLLCLHLAGLPWRDMIQCLPVLQSLEAFQRGQIAPDVFAELSPSWYSLCAFLLKTSIGPSIVGQVIGGLKNTGADKLIKTVVPALDASVQEHAAFLDAYLRHPTTMPPSEGLKIMAGNILVEKLTALSQEERHQPWIPEAIRALADLQGSGDRELLNQISSGKRMLLIPDWPSVCRSAAEETMKKLRRRPRTARTG